LAASHNNLGNVLQAVGKDREAVEQYRQALSLDERLATDFPAVPAHRQAVGRDLNNLGNLFKRIGNHAEAEAVYRRALDLRKQLVADYPAVTDYSVTLGGTYANFANLLRDSGKPAEALDWYQQSLDVLAPVLARTPRLAAARQNLRTAHLGRALALQKLERFAEAVPDWGRAAELDDGRTRSTLLGMQAACLARVEPARAVSEAEALVRGDAVAPELLVLAARVCALSSARVEDAGTGDQYAARAVALLGQARARGHFKDVARVEDLKKETDLDSLRGRDDFKNLIAELQSQAIASSQLSNK
jgi:tetratricopeptide (TPR) repeat protein